jgi:hypothetical protein
MSGQITLPDRQLTAECAAYLARRMRDELDWSEGDIVYNIGMRVYEKASHALEQLGVYAPGKHYTLSQEIVPPERVRAHVLVRENLAPETRDTVLHAFVGHAAAHSTTLPATRRPFRMMGSFAPLTDALLRAGFMHETADGVQWSDRIAPVMQAHHLWDDQGNSLRELRPDRRADNEAEARAFVEGLPDWLRAMLRKTLMHEGPQQALDLLRCHWSGTDWVRMAQADPRGLDGSPAPDWPALKQAFHLLNAGKL